MNRALAFALVALCLAAAPAGAQTLAWSYPLESPGFTPTLYPNECAPAGVAVAAGKNIVLLDGNGNVLSKASLPANAATPVTVADVNADASPDMLVALVDGTVVCVDAQGSTLWQHPFSTPAGGYKYVVAADLLPNKGMESLVGFDDGWLNCLDGRGNVLWRFFGDRGRVGGIAVADADKNGAPEIVYGTDNGHIYCLTAAGRVLWRHTEGAPFGRSGPVFADADGDGQAELYIIRSNVNAAPCLMALDAATGHPRWRSKDIQQGYFSVAPADLDRDGKLELLHGDKANFLYCENPDGSRRWQTELEGRGLYYAPAIADFDGDGAYEFITSVRSASSDRGADLYFVHSDGKIAAAIETGFNVNASATVGDLNGNGHLDLVVAGEGPNQVSCYTWNKTGSVLWSSVRGNSAMTGSGNVALGSPENVKASPLPESTARDERQVMWGHNTWQLAIEKVASENQFVEFSVFADGEPAESRIIEVGADATRVSVDWFFAQGAGANVDARLCSDERWTTLLAAKVTPAPPDMSDFTDVERRAAQVLSTRAAAGGESGALSSQLNALRVQHEAVAALVLGNAANAALANAATALRRNVRQLAQLLDALESLNVASVAPFAAWVDPNPWAPFDPASVSPFHEQIEEPLRVNAYQNEYESAAISLYGLASNATDVRCHFTEISLGQGRPAPDPPETSHIQLRRLVPVLTAAGNRMFDALPELDTSRSITVPSGEVRQLWLTIDTHGLEPGVHQLTLYLSALGVKPYTCTVPLEITVWPVALPDTVYRKINWSNFNPGDASDQAVRDMIAHGINVIYGPPLPSVPVDAQGNPAGAIDWSAFDKAMARVPRHFFLLWSAPAPQTWPTNDTPADPQIQIAAIRTAIHAMADHLEPMGFPYDHWAFYPMDEPWNTGSTGISDLKAFCERVKKAEPRAQNYADPTGGMRIEYLNEFANLIDVWQPETNILKRDPELTKWFQKNARHFWTYEATGPGKDLLPLGYYRMIAWIAWKLGTEGAGYWVYRGEDTWWPVQGGDWSAVYQTNDQVIPSRRWEADRDGVEDYRAFYLLREAAQKAAADGRTDEARQALALIDEAIEKVIGGQIGHIDEITRHVRDYEIDYPLLLSYRHRIAEEILKLRGPAAANTTQLGK